MARYVLDTNVLIHAIRNSGTYQAIESQLFLSDPSTQKFISGVSIGEIYSIAFQNKWSAKKWKELKTYLRKLTCVPIENHETLLQGYMEIEAYSRKTHPVLGGRFTARNMGKNDLWIAATAYFTQSVLVTSDGDFDHLKGIFIEVHNYPLR
jgi:tRNA(fMet)-specific endonuclease VapC